MSRAWISTDPDGRTRYRFHQSWLSDTDLCLERARLGLVGELDEAPNDAPEAGSAMHHGIEHCVDALIEYGEPIDLDGTLELAHNYFTEIIAQPDFRWVKRGERAARTFISLCVTMWHQQVLPTLNPLATEVKFGPYVIYEDERIVIEIGGTIDYIDALVGVADWKTGSKHGWAGKDWEKQRWSIQSTMYTYAYSQLWEPRGWPEPPIPQPFTFYVMRDDKSVQIVNTVRRPEDWAWMVRKIRAVVRQIETGLEGPWPLNDQHALCSAKWCPAWTACKGADVHADWPR